MRGSKVAPALPSGVITPQATTTLAKNADRALRMILMTSGALWGTQIPANIIRVAVLHAGYSAEMMDARVEIWPAILARFSAYLFSLVPPLLNPVIYMYSRPTLCLAFYKQCQ